LLRKWLGAAKLCTQYVRQWL